MAIGINSGSCTYILFLSQTVEIELIFALWAAVSEIWADFQNLPIWAWSRVTSKSSRSWTILSFYPRGLKLSLILLYGQRFLRYRLMSKLPYLGMKRDQNQKVQKLYILPLNPRWSKSSLFFTLWAAVSEIWAAYQNCYVWAWNVTIDKSLRSCVYTLFLGGGGYIFPNRTKSPDFSDPNHQSPKKKN